VECKVKRINYVASSKDMECMMCTCKLETMALVADRASNMDIASTKIVQYRMGNSEHMKKNLHIKDMLYMEDSD
jgi:hypothetical protein